MKIIAKYVGAAHPPVLSLYIHDAPHRRMHLKVIERYRGDLRKALAKIGIVEVIEHQIELWVLFVSPSSPDLGNLYLALEQAMDDKALKSAGPGIVRDDSLIVEQSTRILYSPPKK
jgi:hypothetical protein